MSSSAPARDVVYGDTGSSLVFIPRAHAYELASVHAALGTSSTWGEFRSRISKTRDEEMLKMVDEIPLDDEPFPGYSLPQASDGDYPGWPAQEMLAWMPQEIINAPYNYVEHSVHNGEFLVLDPGHEHEILAALEAAGFTCTKDEELVAHASGISSWASDDMDAEETVPTETEGSKASLPSDLVPSRRGGRPVEERDLVDGVVRIKPGTIYLGKVVWWEYTDDPRYVFCTICHERVTSFYMAIGAHVRTRHTPDQI